MSKKKPAPIEEVFETVVITPARPKRITPNRSAKGRFVKKDKPELSAGRLIKEETGKPSAPPRPRAKASHISAGLLAAVVIGLSVFFVGYTWAPLYRQWVTQCNIANGIPIKAYGQAACLKRDSLIILTK